MDSEVDDAEFATTCPNTMRLFPETFRKPLQNLVDGMCPKRSPRRRLVANEFSMTNINHLKLIKDMGINIIAMGDGRVQLLHSFSSVSINIVIFIISIQCTLMMNRSFLPFCLHLCRIVIGSFTDGSRRRSYIHARNVGTI